jgi:Pentapeptide repeats (8 copies)
MKRLRSHFLVALAAATLTAVVVGGFAWATIPDNMNGNISACFRLVAPNKGSMRVIDHQEGRACHSDERLLTWSTRGFRWRGQWNGRVAYKPNDVVGYNGSSYIASKGTTNVLPSSTGYWSLMTAGGSGVGATGPAGAPGAAGTPGAAGATGPIGPTGSAACTQFPHTGVDWTGCDLTGANLNSAGLANATLINANFTNGLMTSAILSTADLTGANLTGANLTSANLSAANLTNANLTGANLTGANVATTNYTGATFSNTTCSDATNTDTNGGTCVGHP